MSGVKGAMQTLTTLGEMKAGDTFILPWRPPGMNAGRIHHIGLGGATVHQPRHEGDGWETTYVALSTQVVPCHQDVYASQGFGEGAAGGRVMNRSTVKKPVDIVWGLCDEMIGRGTSPTTDQRNAMIEAAVSQGVNENTAKTQFYHWRKKHAS